MGKPGSPPAVLCARLAALQLCAYPTPTTPRAQVRSGDAVRARYVQLGVTRHLTWGFTWALGSQGKIVAMTTTVNLTCDGTTRRSHDVRTAAQFHDKYATSWELTANFGPEPFGSERKVLRVPGAAPGDETRMKVAISCPDSGCPVRKPVRWEKLHAELDKAREQGWSSIPLKFLTD